MNGWREEIKIKTIPLDGDAEAVRKLMEDGNGDARRDLLRKSGVNLTAGDGSPLSFVLQPSDAPASLSEWRKQRIEASANSMTEGPTTREEFWFRLRVDGDEGTSVGTKLGHSWVVRTLFLAAGAFALTAAIRRLLGY